MEIRIRRAREEDLNDVLILVKELAKYEESSEQVTASLADYCKAFNEGIFDVLVAEKASKIVGMALYYPTFSTWKGIKYYLEDFVVYEEFRRQGIGKRLFEAFLQIAREKNAILIKLQALKWNTPALNFYKKYNIELDDEWIDVRLYFE